MLHRPPDAANYCPACGEGFDPIRILVARQDRAQRPATPYHYTSLDGLIGILTSRSVWATELRPLNDAREFLRGMEVAQEAVAGVARNAEGSRKQIAEAVQAALENCEQPLICAFSMCEEGDLLSLWARYCDQWGGFALGFQHDYLNPRRPYVPGGAAQHTPSPSPPRQHGFTLVPCVYDERTQRRLLTDLFERTLGML
jgi:hypothetical protein